MRVGKNVGLDFVAVVVRTEVDGFFIQIFEQRGSYSRETRFGVPVGCWRISVDGAEVALSIH